MRILQASRGIVTGASGGIGRAIAIELAAAGARLVVVARNSEKLHALASDLRTRFPQSGAEVVVGDVTLPEVRLASFERARQAFGGLDFLVNNAGVGSLTKFEQTTPETFREVMELNYFAPVEMIRLCLPELRKGRHPIVVNIASILGRRGVPNYTAYCGSKFALQGFSEALRAELSPEKIELLVVSPGTTSSEFFSNALQHGDTSWKKMAAVTPEHVAKRTVAAMRAGRHQIVVNWRGAALVALNRCCPGVADWLLSRYAE